jgi:ribulose bisphosphate carboxylase small subunit
MALSEQNFTFQGTNLVLPIQQVWNPVDNKKFETLSYLPPLSDAQILRQVEYLLYKGWSPCIEFDKVSCQPQNQLND